MKPLLTVERRLILISRGWMASQNYYIIIINIIILLLFVSFLLALSRRVQHNYLLQKMSKDAS